MKSRTQNTAPTESNHTTQSSSLLPDDLPEIDFTLDFKTTEEHIEQITNRLFGPGVNSTNRLSAMLDYLNDFTFQPEVVWPVFHAVWNAVMPLGSVIMN
jgi:hypothetical protein